MNDHYYDLKKNDPINRFKFLLADKAYESKENRNIAINQNIMMIIPNKKNSKINYYFNDFLYKKRIIIEHSFQKIKTYRRISIRYDNYINSYKNFLYIALTDIITNYLKIL